MTRSDIAQGDERDPSRQSPQPSAEHTRLNVFVGRWNMEGRQHEGPVGSAAPITAVETYEWLAGGFFLIHHFDGRVGDGEAACIEIIGYDPATESYPTRTFYNNGIANQWQSRQRDGVWTLTGAWQMEGAAVNVRCTTTFSDGGATMTGTWQSSSDGSNWQPFWDVRATKAG